MVAKLGAIGYRNAPGVPFEHAEHDEQLGARLKRSGWKRTKGTELPIAAVW